jgi:hypothetical protein
MVLACNLKGGVYGNEKSSGETFVQVNPPDSPYQVTWHLSLPTAAGSWAMCIHLIIRSVQDAPEIQN